MTPFKHIALVWGIILLANPLLGQVPQDSIVRLLDSAQQSIIPEYGMNSLMIPGDPGIQMDIMDSIQLSRYQTLPLAEILVESPAVFIKSYGQVGISTPAFRGTGAGHTQVVWNQLPVNSPMLGLTDLSLGSAGLFEGINILYGSRSLRFGGGGLGGSIHLINRTASRNKAFRNTVQVGQEFGSYGNYRTQLAVGLSKGNWWASTKALVTQGENDFAFKDRSRLGHPQDTLEHSQLRQWTVLQQLGWKGVYHSFVARVWLGQMTRELPPTMLSNNLTETQDDTSLRGQLEWKADFKSWRLSTLLGYGKVSIDYNNLQANIASLSSNRTIDLKSVFHQSEIKSPRLGIRNIGIRLGHDIANSPGYTEQLQLWRGTAFIRHMIHVRGTDRLDILVRESFNQKSIALPFGYVSYDHLLRFNRHLNISLARNVRFPTLNDLYWNPGGNPQLEKEQSYTAEVGYKRLGFLHPNWTHIFQINAYSSLVDNWILWTPWIGNIWRPENVQQVLTAGGEISLQFDRKRNGWHQQIRGGYAFNSSESKRSNGSLAHAVGKQLIYTPQHTGFCSFQVAKGKSFLYYSQQITGTRYTATDHSTSLPAFSLGDLRLGSNRSLGVHRLELYGGVRNLWNADYQAIAWRPMPGRNYYAGLRLQLNFDPS